MNTKGIFTCFRHQEEAQPVVNEAPQQQSSPTKATPRSSLNWQDCPAYEVSSPQTSDQGFSITSQKFSKSKNRSIADHTKALLKGQELSFSGTDQPTKKHRREVAERINLIATIKRLKLAARDNEELLAYKDQQLERAQQEVQRLASQLAAAELHAQHCCQAPTEACPDPHHLAEQLSTTSSVAEAPSTPALHGHAEESTAQGTDGPALHRVLEAASSQLQDLHDQLRGCVGSAACASRPHCADQASSSQQQQHEQQQQQQEELQELVRKVGSQLQGHYQLLQKLQPPCSTSASDDPHPSEPTADDPQHSSPSASNSPLLRDCQSDDVGRADQDRGKSPQQLLRAWPKGGAREGAADSDLWEMLKELDGSVAELQQCRSELQSAVAAEKLHAEALQRQLESMQHKALGAGRGGRGGGGARGLEGELREYRAMVDHLEAAQERMEAEGKVQARALREMEGRCEEAEVEARRLRGDLDKAQSAELALQQELRELRAQVADGPAPDSNGGSPSLGGDVDLRASVVKLVGAKVQLEAQLEDALHEVERLRVLHSSATARLREEHRCWLDQTSTSLEQLEAMGAELKASFNGDRKRHSLSGAAARASVDSGMMLTPPKQQVRTSMPSPAAPFWPSGANTLKPPSSPADPTPGSPLPAHRTPPRGASPSSGWPAGARPLKPPTVTTSPSLNPSPAKQAGPHPLRPAAGRPAAAAGAPAAGAVVGRPAAAAAAAARLSSPSTKQHPQQQHGRSTTPVPTRHRTSLSNMSSSTRQPGVWH